MCFTNTLFTHKATTLFNVYVLLKILMVTSQGSHLLIHEFEHSTKEKAPILTCKHVVALYLSKKKLVLLGAT
jgi:hypothetical protein